MLTCKLGLFLFYYIKYLNAFVLFHSDDLKIEIMMDTTLDFISFSIVGGIGLGLFVSLFCYGFKRILVVNNHNNNECEFVKKGIEMKDIDPKSLSDLKSSISLSSMKSSSSFSSGIYEDPERYINKQGSISMKTTTLIVNDLVRKMAQTKNLEEKVRKHEKMIEKISMETKTLEQKVYELERKMGEDSTMDTGRMNLYELDDEKKEPVRVCACKAGDNFRCLADC